MKKLLLVILLSIPLHAQIKGGNPPPPPSSKFSYPISCGDLIAFTAGNGDATLSGLSQLYHISLPNLNVFSYGGNNWEHNTDSKYEGPLDEKTHTMLYTPRFGPLILTRIDSTTVVLTRHAIDEPWNIDAKLYMHCIPPHQIAFHYEFTPRDTSKFGPPDDYGIVFFASYMSLVADYGYYFPGITALGQPEEWIHAIVPQTPITDHAGIYRHVDADALQYTNDKTDKVHIWTYEWPRFTRSLMCGIHSNNLVFMTVWDKTHTNDDELRLANFIWQIKNFNDPTQYKPAWDWEYVLRHVVKDQTYTINGSYFLFPVNGALTDKLAACDFEYTNWSPWVP